MNNLLIFLISALFLLQNPKPPEIREPEQFYTNGKEVNSWTRDERNKRRYTYWFGKYNEGWAYKQELIFVYDDNSRYVYYWNTESRLFDGRYNQLTGEYSLLPPPLRRKKREDIRDADFPPPSGMPTIGQLLRQPSDAPQRSIRRLAPPPPTEEYPRLQNSSWDSVYTMPDLRRVRARITFIGNHGEYRISESNHLGILTNVDYRDIGKAGFVITGLWSFEGKNGTFKYTIPKNDLNAFLGNWVDQDNRRGVWDGLRAK